MKFKLGCELAYTIVEETVFIFNVEVAQLPRHVGLVDRLSFTPNVEQLGYVAPDIGNRYVRVVCALRGGPP